jgi:hypothetical protein
MNGTAYCVLHFNAQCALTEQFALTQHQALRGREFFRLLPRFFLYFQSFPRLPRQHFVFSVPVFCQ